ncbi:MAG: DUF192 domain-containing protein, partial [Myxococcales bacterium]|nr:DUF192 domain-containing protein [Myxococcales bacterium]
MVSRSPLALVLGCSILLLAACEPRVDEPAQPERQTATEPPVDPASPQKQAAPKLTRCMKPLGEKPKRVVLGTVPNPDCPVDDMETPPVLGRGKVTFHSDSDAKKTVSVEIAKEDAHRQRGLMFRKSMPEDEGMLFIFEESKPLSFWMHNTCIPLDMIFVGPDGTIVGIEENTPTLSDDTFSSGCDARFVIEMNAGWARKNGIQAGQRVKLPL